MIKKITFMSVSILILAIVVLIGILSYRNSAAAYQRMLDKNYGLYSELGSFMLSLDYRSAIMYESDKPYEVITTFSESPPAYKFQYNIESVTKLFCECFEHSLAQVVLRQDDVVIFQIKSSRDHARGLLFCDGQDISASIEIGNEMYSIQKLSQDGWYLYDT